MPIRAAYPRIRVGHDRAALGLRRWVADGSRERRRVDHHEGAAEAIESNGAGALIADAIGRKVPCKPLPTTKPAKEARVEALSAELASGRWIFRQPLGSPGPELRVADRDVARGSDEAERSRRNASPAAAASDDVTTAITRIRGGPRRLTRSSGARGAVSAEAVPCVFCARKRAPSVAPRLRAGGNSHRRWGRCLRG